MTHGIEQVGYRALVTKAARTDAALDGRASRRHVTNQSQKQWATSRQLKRGSHLQGGRLRIESPGAAHRRNEELTILRVLLPSLRSFPSRYASRLHPRSAPIPPEQCTENEKPLSGLN